MAYFFGDGFDLYAQITDCGGYWDGAFGGVATLWLSSVGRFAGSRGVTLGAGGGSTTPYITKTSGQNDAVHHISIAVQQTGALTSTSLGTLFTLYDGATAQCSVVFRSDGALLLTSGIVTGTVLATYTGALAAINTWYQFEIEVVINNTTGSIAVRKNGNTTNDFFLGSLNTRASANNYANKIGMGNDWNSSSQFADDFLWRSDATSGSGLATWVGDIRCFTRMPASDASVQFTRSGSVVPVTPYVAGSTVAPGTSARFAAFTAPCDGAIGSASFNLTVGVTGNLKCSLFANAPPTAAGLPGSPGAVLGSATVLANPAVGVNTVTFGTPVAVTRGTTYWIGVVLDTTGSTFNAAGFSSANLYGTGGAASVTYASFPTANPTLTSLAAAAIFTANITPTTLANAAFVADPATDYTGGYDYSSTVGQSDLYAIGSVASVPGAVVGVTTRAYCEKSDAGTRNLAVQLQSLSGFSATTWNPSDKAANMTLSNGNLTATAANWPVAVRATASQSSGKFYFETTIGSWSSNDCVGLALGSVSLTANPGGAGTAMLNGSGNVWINNVSAGVSFGGLLPSAVVGIAVDLTARLIWFRIGAAGAWNASGTANPATGAGGLDISSLAGALFPYFGVFSTVGSAATGNFGASAFTGAAPSGFTAGFPGAVNVQSPSTALNTTWGWVARNDLVDPATGAAWTASAVSAAQIGVTVTA